VNLLLVAPLLLTLGGIIAGWFLPRFVSPAACARVLTAAVVLATASIGSALLLVTLAASSELHTVSDALGWCRALYPGDHGAAPWAGAIAGALLVAAAVRAVRYRRRVRVEHAPFAGIDGLEVIASDEPVAFAVPGRPGGVVIGSALFGHLDADERTAVLAHENAHLRLHHHRYVHTVELCAAAFPFLLPLARQVRFATERWADETAAAEVGSRRTVARAIARVALMPSSSYGVPSLAFSGRSTSARVDALLHPDDPRRVEVPAAVTIATVVTTLAGSSVQVHHLAMFLVNACRP
jgi:Zn-dependent protease with chaperone function